MATRSILSSAICVLPLIFIPGPSMSEVSAVSSPQSQVSHLLELPSMDYFAITESQLVDLQIALLRSGQVDDEAEAEEAVGAAGSEVPPLLVIGAPREIPATSSQLPVLVGSARSKLREWQVNSRLNLHLLVRDQSTGELVVVEPYNDTRRGEAPARSAFGTPPDAVIAGSRSSTVAVMDLNTRGNRKFGPGELVVTAVLYDLRSNSVGVSFPGAAAPIASEPPKPQPYVVTGEKAGPGTPGGIDLPMEVSVHDPILLRMNRNVGAEDGVLGVDSSRPVWPCNVLMVQLDSDPIVVPAFVPVERIVSEPGTSRFTADFNIDLYSAVRQSLSGLYNVYVDTGQELLGPYQLLITKSRDGSAGPTNTR
jgi:hypothetical protein